MNSSFGKLLLVLIHLIGQFVISFALTKVIVPSVYREWDNGKPHWATDPDVQKKHGYSVFAYQKLNPNASNYFDCNRGTETGVYLKYIVDHYDNFPDVAIFVHAKPHDHQPNWLHMVGCIIPNATWYNINYGQMPWMIREPSSIESFTSRGLGLAFEQCWRDALKIVYNSTGGEEEFNHRFPGTEPLKMTGTSSNQFLMSRAMVHKRPLQVWKNLLHLFTEQPLCHMEEPDYEHLYEYKRLGRKIPEQLWYEFQGRESSTNRNGYWIVGMTGEHLSHVIFGQKNLTSPPPTHEEMCQNFVPGCPGSPCRGVLLQATHLVKTFTPARALWFMVMHKGMRHNVPNMDTLEGLEVPGENILSMDLEEVKMYPEGPPLTPCDKAWVPNVCKDSVYYKALHATSSS